jgi:DNA-binding response OmpR family regulator
MPDRILVIEDDEPTRYTYERALSRAGYRTQGYTSSRSDAGTAHNAIT